MESPKFEALGYIGGDYEGLGGYCEPLIIRVNGEDHYVLHEMRTSRPDPDSPRVSHHAKVEFDSLAALKDAFAQVQEHLQINTRLPWVETDAQCGFGVSE